MAAAAHRLHLVRPESEVDSLNSVGGRLIGLTLAMIVPALFWMAVIATAGKAMGVAFALSAVASVGGAIALFLGAVCAPLMLRD